MKNLNVTIQPMYGCPVAEVKNSIRHHRINTDLARREIIEALTKETNIVQLHDFGSVIGEIIAKYSLKVNAPGEIDDFVDSYSHGVSLATGTHDDSQKNPHRYIKMEYHLSKIRNIKYNWFLIGDLFGALITGCMILMTI